jgi:hypothetical protein
VLVTGLFIFDGIGNFAAAEIVAEPEVSLYEAFAVCSLVSVSLLEPILAGSGVALLLSPAERLLTAGCVDLIVSVLAGPFKRLAQVFGAEGIELPPTTVAGFVWTRLDALLEFVGTSASLASEVVETNLSRAVLDTIEFIEPLFSISLREGKLVDSSLSTLSTDSPCPLSELSAPCFEGDASAAPWLNPTVAFDAEGVAELEEDAAATVGACEDV